MKRERQLEYLCAALAGVTIVAAIVAFCSASSVDGNASREGVRSAVLRFELLRSPEDLPALIGPPGDERRAKMAQAVRADYGLVAAYALLFLALGARGWQRGRPRIGMATAVLGFGGALCDVVENQRMLAALGGENVLPRSWSLWKWNFVFTALLGAARLFATTEPPLLRRCLGYLTAMLLVAAALSGFLGEAMAADVMIESAVDFMGLGILLGFVFLLSRDCLAAGLGPLLDRIAHLSGFRQFAAWPHDLVKDDGYLFEYEPVDDPAGGINGPGRLNGWALRRGGKDVEVKDWALDVRSDGNAKATSVTLVEAPGQRATGTLHEIPYEYFTSDDGHPSRLDVVKGAAGPQPEFVRAEVTVLLNGCELPAVTYVLAKLPAASRFPGS